MIRIGIIGAGPNGTGNARNLAQHAERCRITAVADPNREAGESLAAVYNARAVNEPSDMLDMVDAVVISSPNALHTAHAVLCADAGKHVWIEKPMALTTADADRIVTAVERANVASFVGFSVRFEAVMQGMRQLYDEGVVGRLVTLWSRRLNCPAGQPRKSWRSAYATSGGLMSELLAHEIDWIVNIAGMPTSIYCRIASSGEDDPRANDHVWLTLGFGAGATGTIEGSTMVMIPDYYRGIAGTEGAIFTQHWGQYLVVQRDKDSSKQVELGPAFNKHAHFLDVVEGRCASVADARWGRAIVAISEKALDSAVSGSAVAL